MIFRGLQRKQVMKLIFRPRQINRIGACLFLFAVVCSGIARAESPLPSDPLKLLKEGVSLHTLSNGMRVLFYRRGEAPVFSAVVGVRVGGSDETPGETGISHMFEHMAFKGTQTVGTRNYAREKVLLEELEDIAARTDGAQHLAPQDKARWEEIRAELSTLWVPEAFSRGMEQRGAVGLNASTSSEMTQYFVSLPRDAFEFWCSMESDRLLHPVLRQFYQERDVVREEQRSRSEDDPVGKLLQTFYGVAFLVHPYRQPIIGYVPDIARLTARKLDAFRRRYYVPGNIVLSLVGDVDPSRDLVLLERYFAPLVPGDSPPRSSLVEPAQEGQRDLTIKLDASPQLALGYRKPVYPDPDDARISVMLEMLAGGRTSPVIRELVLQKRLATEVVSDEGPGQAYPNLAVFLMVPRAPHTNREVLRAFDGVLKGFSNGGARAEDLQMAKRTISMSYLQAMQSNSSLASSLASSELVHGSWRALIDWYEQAMSVSLQDVKRVTNAYLVSERRTVGMLEKRGGDGGAQ